MRLKIGLLSSILVLTMLVSVSAMVDNPDFLVDTEGWSIGADYGSLYLDGAGVVGNAMHAQIDVLGENAWEPEIHSPEFGLDMGGMYTMDFWAKTESGSTRELGVKFEQLEEWGGPSGTVTVTDQWEHLYFTGESTFQSPPNSVIHIQFEGSTDDVWFSHFRVYEGEYDPETLASVTPADRLTTAWGFLKRN